MNASVHLLRKTVAATVHLQADIPEDHPSAAILGAERMGTGVFLGTPPAIVTAHYVLIGSRGVQVTTIDGTTASGTIAAIDYASGLGVVTLDDPPDRSLEVRPIEEVTPGQECFVVASVGDGRQVRTGTVASIAPFDAFWEYMLDRAILASPENPGLGGGPIADASGRVIGIAALSLTEVGKFTFGVPASLALPLLEALRVQGRHAPARRAWLGITCYSLKNHVVVAGVIPDSPAAKAGLRSGDLIVAIDGEEVSERRDLFDRLWRRASGDPARLRVFRNNETFEVEVATGTIEDFFA
ncbi:MAG TPA: S1C family serine protease [Candidatus Binatia bacterium]|nr:S1C family serine protease [Candidatus Binatia bacterium]